MTQLPTPLTQRAQPGTVRLSPPLIIAAAMALAVLGRAIAVQALGVSLDVGPSGSPEPIGLFAIAAVPLLVGLAGWALLAACRRVFGNGRRIWQVIACAVLAVSLLGPIGLARDGATLLTLLLLHLAVGTTLILGLSRGADSVRTAPVGEGRGMRSGESS